MTGSTIRSLRRIQFERHLADGVLSVFEAEASAVPFEILRVFTITGVSADGVRGNHAHRGCTQLLACLAGRVTVSIHDGVHEVDDTLTEDGASLLIPPMLWNSVSFEGPSTVLAVFCDEHYDPRDYLRDWDEYLDCKG
jgi:dTDP-4-dehydrorhamnose 3,5-epimerase-like enzyme